MTIDYAILGLLSRKPLTGYGMRRVMQEPPLLYRSGNNNQIYEALVKLLENGFATSEVQYQKSTPSKKIYSITEAGAAELRKRVISTEPEIPELKKTFPIQLSWSGLLESEEIDELLTKYEKTVTQQLAMHKEEKRREKDFSNRSEQEHFAWEMIYHNYCVTYEAELQWIQQFRERLKKYRQGEQL